MNHWPSFKKKEIDAVTRVLRSGRVNYWTGTEGRQFEKEYAEHLGVNHAIAVANGSVALELALIALGIGKGDEVIVTPRSFIASVSCVHLVGAKPVFADVDPKTGNLTAESIAKVLNKKTKALVLVHLAGWPCEMDDIMSLSKKHSLKVIEDCAQSHGATYRKKPVGSIGHIGCFSFCQDKIITTGGEGGMVVTDDKRLWETMWSYKDHGKSYDTVFNKTHPPGFRWLHESVGTNWRMTEMQSTIGRIWLSRLNEMVDMRREIADKYDKALAPFSCVQILNPPAHIRHSYYRYYFYLKPEELKPGWNRGKIMDEFNKRGIPCFSGTCSEIYKEKAMNSVWNKKKPLKHARHLGEVSLTLPNHPALSKKDIRRIIKSASEILNSCNR